MTMITADLTHTKDCVHPPRSLRTRCQPRDSRQIWSRPDGWSLDEAKGQLDDETPWCRIRQLAFDLASEEQ